MLCSRRTAVVAAAVASTLAVPALAHAQVVDSLVATTVPGLLTMAGVGANVALSPTPGTWTSSVGATAITVSDLTASDNGWRVTATYSDPVAGSALGAANVRVSSAYTSGPITGGSLNLVTDETLESPVVVAKPDAGSGSGVTVLTTSYEVRVPETAQAGDVYGGTVTYTLTAGRG
jgi:hypothetical protein